MIIVYHYTNNMVAHTYKPSKSAIHTAMARLASGKGALPASTLDGSNKKIIQSVPMSTTMGKHIPLISGTTITSFRPASGRKSSILSHIMPALAVPTIPRPSTLAAKVTSTIGSISGSTLEEKVGAPTVSASAEPPSIMEVIAPILAQPVEEVVAPKSTLSMSPAKEESLAPPSTQLITQSQPSFFAMLFALFFGK
jgi:hypothetical protein